jgi:hypothetical protein
MNRRTSILLGSMLVAALLMAFASLAAFADGSSQAVSGFYNFRGLVDSGPTDGLYITGALELRVTPTRVSGHLCGISYSSSHCASLSGTNVDGTNITFVVNKLGKASPLDVAATFHSSNGKKGSFTGFSGTFGFGASSGHWSAVLATTPSTTGQQAHGTLALTEDATGKIVGTYCPSVAGSTCSNVKGTNSEGYLNLFIEAPVRMILRGTFTQPGRADGQFYNNGTNDTGYWLMTAA